MMWLPALASLENSNEAGDFYGSIGLHPRIEKRFSCCQCIAVAATLEWCSIFLVTGLPLWSRVAFIPGTLLGKTVHWATRQVRHVSLSYTFALAAGVRSPHILSRSWWPFAHEMVDCIRSSVFFCWIAWMLS